MQLGEVAFGGVGSGLYGMLAFVLLTVFVAGLLVGRTPEYLGNKIERREITLVIIALLVFPFSILIPAAVAAVASRRDSRRYRMPGRTAFPRLLYAFTSSAASNGSAMGGLGPNAFYNVATGLAMGAARYAAIIPTLALAGAFAAKPRNDMTRGTLQTDTPLFAVSNSRERDRRRRAYVLARRRTRTRRRSHSATRRHDVLAERTTRSRYEFQRRARHPSPRGCFRERAARGGLSATSRYGGSVSRPSRSSYSASSIRSR